MAPPDAVDEVVDVGKKSAFWWVNVARKARKAVACAVVLLIIAVSVYAVVVVFRRGELDVFVLGGSLSLSPTITTNSQVQWLFVEIALYNAGGRSTMYYNGVTAKLVERKNTSPTAANTIVNLPLGDIIVEQQSTYFTYGHGNTTSYGEMFLRNNLTAGAAAELILILHGNLTTDLFALYNRTSTPTTYNCYNVTVGGSSENNVECQKSAAAKQLWLNCSIFLVISLFLVINTEY